MADAAAAPAGTPRRTGKIVDSAAIPGGGQLLLVRDGADFEILCDGEQLMGNWATQSERALATLVFERLGPDPERLLIGGLGMGFTLAAALAAAPATTAIEVVEVVPEVVAWAKGPLAHIVGGSLADRRVALSVGDVHDTIAARPGAFDAILLDVDNGPDGLVMLANERLYCAWGLRTAYAALRPGGILAIWSGYPDATFSGRLEKAGFSVEEIAVSAGDADDPQRHTIWLASKAR